MRFTGKAALAGLAIVMAGVSAGAQENSCAVDTESPKELSRASRAITLAMVQGKPAEKQKQLREAVSILTKNPDRIQNTAGRNLLLGRALSAWSQVPDVPAVPTRGTLGYETNKDEPIDVLAAADSALTAVETAMPGCTSETLAARQAPWVPLINGAIAALNAEQTDSAEFLARRSLIIYRDSPYPYNVLAAVAQKKGNNAEVITMLRKTVEKAGTDTAVKEIREASLLALASMLSQEAATAPAAEQKAQYADAARHYREYLAIVPNDPQASAGLAEALLAAGDTAGYDAHYNAMASNAAAFTDIQLFRACTETIRADRPQLAVVLCEAGLAKNPYYRDGLYVLATAYYTTEKPEKMLPVAQRLVEVDPSNPDSWQLLAGAYQLRAKELKEAKAKRSATDSVVAAMQRAEALPARVTFTRFNIEGAKRTLAGSVENLGTASKSFPVKIEFLDKSGSVVATEEVNVGPVGAKQAAEFTVTAEGDGIVAYRYAPLT